MDFIIHFLTQYGYWGMFLAAFLAGSVFPFSSEAVIIALMATGLDPWMLMIYGTAGNVLGSALNYCIGRMGKMEWIENTCTSRKRTSTKHTVSWQVVEPGWDSSPFSLYWAVPLP